MFSPVFVSLKPKWEPFRLSSKLLKTESAVLNRLSPTKWDIEAYHLQGRPASCKGWEAEWSEPSAQWEKAGGREEVLPPASWPHVLCWSQRTRAHAAQQPTLAQDILQMSLVGDVRESRIFLTSIS